MTEQYVTTEITKAGTSVFQSFFDPNELDVTSLTYYIDWKTGSSFVATGINLGGGFYESIHHNN